MQAFEDKDLFLYFLIAAYLILKDHGLLVLVQFSLSHGFFFFCWLPYVFLCNRVILPFPYHSVFSQRATDFEYVIVEFLKYHFKYLIENKVGYTFLDGQIFRILHKMRSIREIGDGLGDISIEDVQDIEGNHRGLKGLFMYSKSRVSKFDYDVLILYVHGGLGFGMGSADMYSEYLSIFLVNLLEQGFTNPALLAPSFPSDRLEKYPIQMAILLNSYHYLNTLANANCHIVLMGDSTGATLLSSLLLQISNPSPYMLNYLSNTYSYNETRGGFSAEVVKTLKKPSYCIMISPIPNIYGYHKVISNEDDYLTEDNLKNWTKFFVDDVDESTKYLSPGQCSDVKTWQTALPTQGLLITYGTEEIISEDIEQFIGLLTQTGCKLKVDKQLGQVHNWPIVNFYGERLIDHREYSLQLFTGVLSRMLLHSTKSFFEVGAKPPLNIVRIDDDYT
ncbi:uncharacterized protein RJT21DRAFT_11570 [Scheffersomyces amazonensis]|uniref:uncharacterized protein n=1 Tax=Scheffersomyces amazonensis TaxID=1078765 RepID=UPI00315DCE06